jgi:HK97 family phage prohead protease
MLHRQFTADLEVRAGGDGRTVHGIAVPFDMPTEIREFWETYTEIFDRGAFAKTIAERGDKVKFLYQHDSAQPIGRATLLREDKTGLYAEFRVSQTALGDDVLAMVGDGTLDGLSIGFVPVLDRVSDGGAMVHRTEVKLREVSSVTFPAYEDALISGVRAASREDLKRATELAAEWRAGSTLSAPNVATLKHVLSLVASADRAVDEVMPLLADLLGVPNPDKDADTPAEAAAEGEAPRGMALDLATRKARLFGIKF